MRVSVLVLWLALAATSAAAANPQALDVRMSERGRYEATGYFDVDASVAAVFAIITDYDRLDRLDDTIVESVLLERQADTAVVRTLVRPCLMFICRRVERVEQVVEHRPNEVTATLLPERSDIEFQVTRWRLEPQGAGTRVSYYLVVVPGFFVPRWVAERQIRASLTNTVIALQTLALEAPVEVAGE